ncbi:hypothetical protein CERSUDRAFT_74257 [Gelatoporia subvermispora B]|uniref:Zn(2)-C6 fungal-type domain-containing protein n=1 Tax=Ceriporiopsis subvermispora (strain B) TaxID=914234 RepID=M2QGQ9_CERS8|nr:hypothetical protein CERSUDRAFT_74257 [Gelatoporia subvermispora B]
MLPSNIDNAQFLSHVTQILRAGFAEAASVRPPEDPEYSNLNYHLITDEPASTGMITPVNSQLIGGWDQQPITDDTTGFPFWLYIPDDVLPDLNPDFDFDQAEFDLSVRFGITAAHTNRDARSGQDVNCKRMILDVLRGVDVFQGYVEHGSLLSPHHITHHYPLSSPPPSPSTSSWSSADSISSTSGYLSVIRTDGLVSDDETDDGLSGAGSEEPEDAGMGLEDVVMDAEQSGPRRPFGTACDFCKIRKLKCRNSAGEPCGNCVMRGQACLHTIKAKTRGRKPKNAPADESTSVTIVIEEDRKGKGVLRTSQRQKKGGDVVKAKRRAVHRNAKGKGRA